eukprot:8347378-Pyramimonas_sp.AAC.1
MARCWPGPCHGPRVAGHLLDASSPLGRNHDDTHGRCAPKLRQLGPRENKGCRSKGGWGTSSR